MADLPELYFRIRENGALVFRVTTSERDGRLDLDPLAAVNLRTGEAKPQGARRLTDRERTAIDAWIAARRATLAARRAGDPVPPQEQVNLTAQWAQAKATDAELDAVTDALLLAMHDLRMVLVKRKADRLAI